MSDLFDEASFPATATNGKLVTAVRVDRAREISRHQERTAAYFATAPLRAALVDLIPLARLALAAEANAEVRAAQRRVIDQADQTLQGLRRASDDEHISESGQTRDPTDGTSDPAAESDRVASLLAELDVKFGPIPPVVRRWVEEQEWPR